MAIVEVTDGMVLTQKQVDEAGEGSIFNIRDGQVDDNVYITNSTVNISGGVVGNGLDVIAGSQVNISGGTVGDNFMARNSTVNISGGSIGDNFDARNSRVIFSGGFGVNK